MGAREGWRVEQPGHSGVRLYLGLHVMSPGFGAAVHAGAWHAVVEGVHLARAVERGHAHPRSTSMLTLSRGMMRGRHRNSSQPPSTGLDMVGLCAA